MDYRISDDGQLLRDSLRRYLIDRIPQAVDVVDHTEVWKDVSSSGWLEAFAHAVKDGQPAGLVEALHLVEAFGEIPSPGPVAVVAGFVLPLIDALGGVDVTDRTRAGWLLTAALPRLAGSGSAARWTYQGQEVTLRDSPNGLVVDGVLDPVPGADHADALLVPARRNGRTVLLIVPLDAAEVAVTAVSSLDLRHGAARVSLADAPVASIVESDDVDSQVHSAATAFSLFLDAEAVGGATEVTERTIAYVSQREQFGRPVGSFQAVRHKLADMALCTETARALAYRAAWDLRAGTPSALLDVLASRLYSSAAYVNVCESAIQCHGGMGFTWEQGLHVWYRAALAGRGLLTDVSALQRALGAHLQSIAEASSH